MLATGLIVTVTVKVAPGQVPGGDVGVMLYVAVPVALSVLLLNSVAVRVVGEPVLAAPPLMPDAIVGMLQAYVVPAGKTVVVGVYVKAAPLHIVAASFWEATIAAGLTVTVTVNTAPAQLPGAEVGVTTYVAVNAPVVV